MPDGKAVLIVDDEKAFAENLLTYLQRRAHEAGVAHDGDAAIELAKRHPPAVIVVDYNLPGIDGLQTIRRIAGRHRHCGCLLMSGHLTEAVLSEARRTGIRHVLVKPFSLSELDALLNLPIEELLLSPPAGDGTEPCERIERAP